jgi:exopolysaccharide biosynthesis polyprenyl glycosylphosphotransferase
VLQLPPRIERILILGTTPLAVELVAAIRSQPHCHYAVVGAVGEGADVQRIGCPVLGTSDDLPQILAHVKPDRIVIAMGEQRGRLPVHHLVQARISNGVRVDGGERFYEHLTGKLAIDSLTPSRFIFTEDFRPSAVTLGIARIISVVVAVLGLVFLSPLLALMALAIRLDSPGPILFVQERIGQGGRPFKLFKFRTMRPARRTHSEWVRDNDDRITRVGRWFRKFRFDELPQFINVLLGDMNLVGPRPHPHSNLEMFSLVSRNVPQCGEQIPYYTLRCMIRPGITGWAQVRYRYANDLGEEMEKLRYDLYYVKHHSFWLDMRVLFETVKVVVMGHRVGTETPHAAPMLQHSATAETSAVKAALTPAPKVLASNVATP